MTGIFRQKAPGNIILLIIVGVLLKLPVFFSSKGFIIKDSDSDLYRYLVSFIQQNSGDSAFVFASLAFILNILIAFILVNFTNTDRFVNKANYLIGMAYILITSFLPAFNLFSSNLLASVLMLLTFRLLFRSYHVGSAKSHMFNAGLLISVASLLFLPSIIFLLWGFIALLVLRPFRITEWIILLLGIIMPYYFYAAYLFLTDNFNVPEYFFHLSFISTKISLSLWHAGALFLLLAPLLAGFYYVQINADKMLAHIRKGWYLFLWYLVIAVLIALFEVDNSFENIVPILVPVAAFHGYGYLNTEVKQFPLIAFWVTAAFIITAQLYSQIW